MTTTSAFCPQPPWASDRSKSASTHRRAHLNPSSPLDTRQTRPRPPPVATPALGIGVEVLISRKSIYETNTPLMANSGRPRSALLKLLSVLIKALLDPEPYRYAPVLASTSP